MTAQRPDDSEGAAPMGPRAWGMHVVAVLRDPEPHRRLLAAPARRPFAGARRHALVEVDTEEAAAEVTVITGFRTLTDMGISTTDGHTAKAYLPARLLAEDLASGLSRADLGRALQRLLARGIFMREAAGQHRNHRPRSILRLAIDELQACGGPAPGARQHPNHSGALAAIES